MELKEISFEIDESLYKDFCVACARENINDVVERLIRNYIKSNDLGYNTSKAIISANEEDTKQNISLLSKPKKIYIVKGQEYTDQEFERYLRNNRPCSVERTISYTSGKTKQDMWVVTNFTEYSSLNANVSSGPLRDWRERGIVGLKLEIK